MICLLHHASYFTNPSRKLVPLHGRGIDALEVDDSGKDDHFLELVDVASRGIPSSSETNCCKSITAFESAICRAVRASWSCTRKVRYLNC